VPDTPSHLPDRPTSPPSGRPASPTPGESPSPPLGRPPSGRLRGGVPLRVSTLELFF